jgi:hypothetical protein
MQASGGRFVFLICRKAGIRRRIFEMKKKIISALLCATMAATLFAGCGSSETSDSGSGTSDEGTSDAGSSDTGDTDSGDEGTADESTADEDTNTISGDASAADAFVVWGWNDDIKNILDNCFANDNPDDYARIVFVNSGGSDYYQTQIDALLDDPSNSLYPDLMGLEIDYVQKYVQSGTLLSMADLGISDDELASQYDFNRVVCSTDGTGSASAMYASFWQATPGAWVLRADLCEKYLGTTDPDELQAKFATWADVEATAQEINDASNGACKILSGWDDLNRVFMNNRNSGWYDSDDNIVVDDQVKAFFEEAKLFYDNDWTFNTTQWGSDWYAMMDGDGESSNAALAYTGCPWFQYWCLSSAWQGQTITIAGPQSFYWGGTGLAVPTGCSDTELAAKIIRYFTTETDSMQTIAKYNCDFLNNADANAALYADSADLADLANGNGLMFSQNYLEVYSNILANMTIDTSIVRSEDKVINDNIGTYIKEYLEGGDYDASISDLVSFIHDTYSYLNIQ